MQRALILTAGLFLTVLFAHEAYAGPYDSPGDGGALKAGQTGTVGDAAQGKSGSSVVERDKKRYAVQKRAAERRAAEMKKAESAKSGSSVVERDKKRYEVQKKCSRPEGR